MPEIPKKSSVVMITSNGMSNAEPELSQLLLSNYLKLLIDESLLPNAILFYGEGVKTVVENSLFIASLQKLEQNGVKLIVCKTCLNFYDLLDKIKVGNIGSMADIVHYQWNVDKVITL
ncbi:MAG: DsrE family protein [Bacteroidales bacterium]|nr:DsrE family protein [Bacteroidales bacterium]